MTVYYVLLCTILLLGWLQKSNIIKKNLYCNIIGILFALVTGLRSQDVGSDTTIYYIGYENFIHTNNIEAAIANHEDVGYFTFAWLYAHEGLPFWALTLTVSIFFYFAVTKFIRSYSSDPTLSFLILMAFSFFQFSMTGIRQTIAFGFTLLALNEAFRADFSYKKILIYILLGYLFHKSCLIFLLLIPILLFKNKVNNIFVIISIIFLFIGLLYNTDLMSMMLALSSDTRFEEYEIDNLGAGLTTYLLYFAIYLILIFNLKNYERLTRRGGLDICLVFFSVLFQSTVLVQSIMFRIVWYFSIALIIILPQMIQTFTKSNRRLADAIVYSALLYMYLGITMQTAHVVPYKFFWQ